MLPTRKSMIDGLTADTEAFDFVVVGGGATGVGIAVDAAARGYRVALFEQCDFGKGTSTRSTKLIHGGVRYLAQGRLSLVRESLRERAILCQTAPHLVHKQSFIVPLYRWWERPYYRTGLGVYDWLAAKHGIAKSRYLSLQQTTEHLPTIQTRDLRGGIVYFDAAFDDARLLIDLVKTAVHHGAVCLNYMRVRNFIKNNGHTRGVVVEDAETGEDLHIKARVVINATGSFVDALRKLDEPSSEPIIVPSQGIHIVLDRRFLPGNTALIVPKTRDGRVMFAIPWHEKVLIGTTDTPVGHAVLEPLPQGQEIDFLLESTSAYLTGQPTRAHIRSVFAGIRPLVRSSTHRNTSKLSRSHAIMVSNSGLMTITGGKWTTYRKMAEQCVNRAVQLAGLAYQPCVTETLSINGPLSSASTNHSQHAYGGDADNVKAMIDTSDAFAQPIHNELNCRVGEVAWYVRREFARTVEDVLARRSRALFLDAQAALDASPRVAELMAVELGQSETWRNDQVEQFRSLAHGYLCPC